MKFAKSHYSSSTGASYVNMGVSNLLSHFRNKPEKFRKLLCKLIRFLLKIHNCLWELFQTNSTNIF